MRNDLYGILNVVFNATQQDIKKAYRQLAKQHHPDKYEEESTVAIDAAERFKEISNAYNTLKDSDRRQTYDSTRGRGFQGSDSSTSCNRSRPVYEEEWSYSGDSDSSQASSKEGESALDEEWGDPEVNGTAQSKRKTALDEEWGDFTPS